MEGLVEGLVEGTVEGTIEVLEEVLIEGTVVLQSRCSRVVLPIKQHLLGPNCCLKPCCLLALLDFLTLQRLRLLRWPGRNL